MSTTLTDEHHDWASSFLGTDTREGTSGAPPPPPPADAAPPAVAAPEIEAAPPPPPAAPEAAAPPQGNGEAAPGGFLDTLSDLAHGAADKLSEAKDKVVEVAGDVKDKAVEVAGEVKDKAVEIAGDVKDKAVELEHAAEEKLSEAKDKVVEVAGEVKDKAVELEHAAEEKLGEIKDKAVELATEAKDKVVELGQAAEKKAGELYQDIKTAITGKGPLPPDLPKARADERMKALPPEDQKKVQALMDNAKSDQEKRYLTKGLAAGHTPAELEEFAKKINGKDDKWLNDHLRLVGDSNGKGIKQQWHTSCAPTTVQAVQGELDPLYAMKMREENPDLDKVDENDPMKMNPKMAQDQKDMLVKGGGVATPVKEKDVKGRGMWPEDELDKRLKDIGVTYDREEVTDEASKEEAMNTMQSSAHSGVPVPIVVGDPAHPSAHAAVVTGVDDGPPRTFTIHDPGRGETHTFTEDQIKNNKVNVGGWTHLQFVYNPSAKKQ